MISRRLVYVSAILLSLLGTEAGANRFRDNPEFAIDRVREAWTAPIGELEGLTAKVTPVGTGYKEERAAGTGFLVSPCYVLTAHHVVYGGDIIPVPGTDYRMKFRAGTALTAPFAGNTTATPVASGFRDESSGDDWALLRLTTCVGKRPEIGWLETSDAPLARTTSDRTPAVARVLALGYDADKDRGVLTGGMGEIKQVDPRNGLRTFTGSYAPGASGGPVIVIRNGVFTAVALNVGEMIGVAAEHGATYPTFSADRANLIQELFPIVNRPNIKAMLDQDKAAWGLPNPNLPRLRMSHLPQRK